MEKVQVKGRGGWQMDGCTGQVHVIYRMKCKDRGKEEQT